MSTEKPLDSRNRFLSTLLYHPVDRIPFLDEGIREEVLKEWQLHGMPRGVDLEDFFHYDRREEIDLDLAPRPYPRRWPRQPADLKAFLARLDPEDQHRLPDDWQNKVRLWQERDYPLILHVHRGFFLTLGVGDWYRFYEVIYLTKDQPELVRSMLAGQGEFAARLAERILTEVDVDAVLFSEPIGGNNGPIISPGMYRDLVLPSYQPLMEVFRRFSVPLVIMRTYANPSVLLKDIFNIGINCLWACETPPGEIDYLALRKQYGTKLRLIAGIDVDALRIDKETIRQEMEKVPLLLAQGGYIPLLDGRVRIDVPYENYRYYRGLLEEMVRG